VHGNEVMQLQEEPADRFAGSYKQQSPILETKNRSATPQTFRFLRNQNFHYLPNKNTLLVPVINEMNPVHTLLSCCDEHDHLLGNGSLKRVLMSTKTQQNVSMDTGINKQDFHRYRFLESPGVSATTGDRYKHELFCVVPVIPYSRNYKSEFIGEFNSVIDSSVTKFRIQFSRWVFSCEVLTR
jgi:hypothetical protein